MRACTNMRAHKRSGNQLGVAGATSLASTLPALTGLQTLLLRRESRVCVRERECREGERKGARERERESASRGACLAGSTLPVLATDRRGFRCLRSLTASACWCFDHSAPLPCSSAVTLVCPTQLQLHESGWRHRPGLRPSLPHGPDLRRSQVLLRSRLRDLPVLRLVCVTPPIPWPSSLRPLLPPPVSLPLPPAGSAPFARLLAVRTR